MALTGSAIRLLFAAALFLVFTSAFAYNSVYRTGTDGLDNPGLLLDLRYHDKVCQSKSPDDTTSMEGFECMGQHAASAGLLPGSGGFMMLPHSSRRYDYTAPGIQV